MFYRITKTQLIAVGSIFENMKINLTILKSKIDSCCHFERSEKSLEFKHLHNYFLFKVCW